MPSDVLRNNKSPIRRSHNPDKVIELSSCFNLLPASLPEYLRPDEKFDILSDRTGLLLGNAVDISAPIHNLPCHDANHLPIRKHFLYLRESQRVIFIPVLGNNDTSVDNQKIQIGSDAEISSLRSMELALFSISKSFSRYTLSFVQHTL